MKQLLFIAMIVLAGCDAQQDSHERSEHSDHEAAEAITKGPHNGRMLVDGQFALELAIFESGVPPEFHVWPTLNGKPLPLDQVSLNVELTRLGGKIDTFVFAPQGDYLRANAVVPEPHSFGVKVTASYAGQSHAWTYASFEGRTHIAPEMAESAGIATEIAGPATLVETLPLYGRIVADPTRRREVSARFPGLIREVRRSIGDHVNAGEPLAIIESNESLQSYALTAPIGGVIASRDANPGEQSADHVLFTIVDPSRVVAELSVFPRDRARVKRGANVRMQLADSNESVVGKVDRIELQSGANQSVLARVPIENGKGELLAGSFVTGHVAIAERKVPLAVRASALQPFRDFTVVFEQIGDEYEVRMLELGERQGDWVEVLSGVEAGARYVVTNSYLIKADIEKSGASHDH